MEREDRSSGLTTREPYEPPELVTIDLAADQVLAAGCKNASGVARFDEPACGVGAGCSVTGS